MYDPATTNGYSQSIWYSTLAAEDAAALVGDGPFTQPKLELDVAIIGAGLAGLSVAYHLCKRGVSVAVFDKGLIGCGETGRTTAHLATALDDRYTELERVRGAEGARLAAESHAAAIADIERIVATEAIACEFERVPGYLESIHGGARAEQELERELEAAQRAGLSVRLVRDANLMGAGSFLLRFEIKRSFSRSRISSALRARSAAWAARSSRTRT